MNTQQQPPASLYATLVQQEQERHTTVLARLRLCRGHLLQLDKLRPQLLERDTDVVPTAGGLITLSTAKAKALCVREPDADAQAKLLIALLELGAVVLFAKSYEWSQSVCVRIGRLHLWMSDLPPDTLPDQDFEQATEATA